MNGLDRSAKTLRNGRVPESGWIQISMLVYFCWHANSGVCAVTIALVALTPRERTYCKWKHRRNHHIKRLMWWHFLLLVGDFLMRSTSDEPSWGAHKRPLGNPADFLSKLRVGPMVPWCNTTISGRKFMGLHGAWREHPAEVLGHLRAAFRVRLSWCCLEKGAKTCCLDDDWMRVAM